MIKAVGDYFTRWTRKYMPDPFLFAIILSAITYVMGLVFTENGPLDMILHWYKGFWELLAFGMQMCLILVTGYALAVSGPVRRVLEALARIPKTNGGAAAVIALVAAVAAYLNWGLGLIIGAMLVKEVAKEGHKKGLALHYPLLGAAGYVGLAVWHQGFSGSVPLLIATKGHFLEKEIGLIPIQQTLFSPMNLVLLAVMVVFVPLVARTLAPRPGEEVIAAPPEVLREEPPAPPPAHQTPAEKLENSMWLSLLISLAGLVYIGYWFKTKGLNLDINIVNFIFLMVGILLHKTPASYLKAIAEGTKGCAGIILQFPFYAGIMGMMKYSGLVTVIAGWFVAISSAATYPIWTYLSACIVNLFVPSGGGQWAVQGPVMVKAAQMMHVSVPKAAMAVAYGDQWTNLFQPFWALPLLGITGLGVRDIMGYCITIMLLGLPIFILAVWLLPA